MQFHSTYFYIDIHPAIAVAFLACLTAIYAANNIASNNRNR